MDVTRHGTVALEPTVCAPSPACVEPLVLTGPVAALWSKIQGCLCAKGQGHTRYLGTMYTPTRGSSPVLNL